MDQFNFNDFPSSNFNEMNLDWLLSLVQQLTELVESGRYGVPAGGATGQVLGKTGPEDYETGWIDQTGGGGGTSNYAQLTNKPQINGVELLGNKTAAQLNLVAAQAGMGLSQNSFTNEEKAVLDSLYFVDQSNTYAQLETAYAAGKKILFFESGELFPIMLRPTNQFWFLHPILNGGMRSVYITTTQNWSFRTEANPLSAVQYVAQTLTEAQKAQARTNIGAISLADLPIYNGEVGT